MGHPHSHPPHPPHPGGRMRYSVNDLVDTSPVFVPESESIQVLQRLERRVDALLARKRNEMAHLAKHTQL